MQCTYPAHTTAILALYVTDGRTEQTLRTKSLLTSLDLIQFFLRWLLCASNIRQSGRMRVFVDPLSPQDGRWRCVSSGPVDGTHNIQTVIMYLCRRTMWTKFCDQLNLVHSMFAFYVEWTEAKKKIDGMCVCVCVWCALCAVEQQLTGGSGAQFNGELATK